MRRMSAGIAALVLGGHALAAVYHADLGPMPLDDETKAFIAGRGEAEAIVEGNRLTVKGRFSGLPSHATAASLWLSPTIGVPGAKALPLDMAGTTEGTISGSFQLTTAQARALRTGRLYVQIESEKAPPGYSWGPKGTLWGWLLPDHDRAAPGVPQQGKWFIPQLDTPAR